MGAARLALVPRELDVALRCVELHVVGERQDGVRRGVGGERLPWLVVHPVDAGSALLLPAPIDRRGALVEVRQLHQGLVAHLPRNRCERNRQTSSLPYKTMYHAYRKTRLRVHVRVLRCRLRWQSSRSYRYSMPIPPNTKCQTTRAAHYRWRRVARRPPTDSIAEAPVRVARL